MNILQDFRALFVAALVILVIIGLFWHKRKKRPKTGPENRQAAHDLAATNRSVRRNDEFAEVKDDSNIKRRHMKQTAEYEKFLGVLERLKEAGRIHRWSTFTFGKYVLEELEKAVLLYTNASTNQGRISTTVSAYQWILFHHVAKVILEYSNGKGLQAIALELIKISEKYYKLKGLNGVLYRHKGHIHYNDRCEGMSIAILNFFVQHVPTGTLEEAMYPFDMLPVSEVYSDEMFRRTFYQKAIDVTYAEVMEQVEKTNYAAQARKDQQEHEKNRRQRAKRVTRKNRRK
jgi:hypothetical protein